jgi:TolB-like protein/class 3 adenylate cyclase/Tfp pilus assembly protein PilF
MERKLAAILAVDVVGYSSLMETDEAGTFDRLRASRKELFEPEINKHHGRIFKLMGDGLLAEFGSVVDAVECAVTLQRGMMERNISVPEAKRIELRIGINLGDVIVEGEDRYGEGVNVAARLQQLADPGGICVSGKVSKEVEKKLAFGFEPMGEHRIKNISEPIACYRVSLQPLSPSQPKHSISDSTKDSNKLTIAVLPFSNMSGEPEQEYFVDGLAEDLITDLSKVPRLFVISRHSTFAFKGKSIDVRSIARELGVRYVVEGSVRRAAARIRITVQLINAEDGTHLWADRFDRDLADVFSLQDEVVSRMVSALTNVLPSARHVGGRRPTSLEAYDLFVRGRELVTQSPESNRSARPLLEKSVERDPEFAEAHAWLAMSYAFGWLYWGERKDINHPQALAAGRKAVQLDPDNSHAHTILGYVLLFDGDVAGSAAEFEAALRINPNHADALMFQGEMYAHQGAPERGIETIMRAFRLNPYPPGRYYWALGFAQYAAKRYNDAIQTLSHKETRLTASSRILAASLAQVGRLEEAKEEARQFLTVNPHFSIQHWASTQPFRHERDRQHFVEGYLKAGLPM